VSDDKTKPLSLLSPETTGGDTAEGGFTFQEAVILAQLPGWLARDGFTAVIREAMLDGEASFFVPGVGLRREGLEAKNHTLTPASFWEEIETFRRQDEASPKTFEWFTLVCTGLSAELRPLVNGLRRLRGAYGFYERGSGVRENSYVEYVERVRKQGQEEKVAQFLFEKVLIEPDWSLAQSHGEGIFRQNLLTHHPSFQEVPSSIATNIHGRLQSLIKSRRGQAVPRHEIEEVIAASLRDRASWPTGSVRLFTAKGDEDAIAGALRLDWGQFFGGDARTYPEPSNWDRGVTSSLRQLREWLTAARRPRRLRLSGTRRLTPSLAIGAEFSAVAGFAIEMEYRDGVWWRTDAHAMSDTPAYSLNAEFIPGTGDRLVVAVAIPRPIIADVQTYMKSIGIDGTPSLHLYSTSPIVSPDQANAVAAMIKGHIADTLVRTGVKVIDLFFAGPAPLALFLGHRLNATAPVQCYEWVSAGQYVPTCRLFGDKS